MITPLDRSRYAIDGQSLNDSPAREPHALEQPRPAMIGR